MSSVEKKSVLYLQPFKICTLKKKVYNILKCAL